MLIPWPNKPVAQMADYDILWGPELDGDVITGSSWTVIGDGALTLISDSFEGTISKIWLGAGTAGVTYTLSNKVTTSDGAVLVEQVQVKVVA